ncbi:MAG: DUF1800 family protein [Polyangiaceae bacterium]|nr:DUF1800 family protein [Polyangiaceae bacterium]
MKRHAALALCLGIAACQSPNTQGEADIESEELGEAQQAVETLTDPSEENSIRFLEQATFGPRLQWAAATPPTDSVEQVVDVGITASITALFSGTNTPFDGTSASQSLDAQFFVQAIDHPDQLRQRVAFALSQIVVVSLNGLPTGTTGSCVGTPAECQPKEAMADYLNYLKTHSLGNYKNLLSAVTKSPAMGRYLDMVNNRAFDTAGAPIEPNENFARELLQLFSLGTHMLNDDGTYKLSGGNRIPAYTEDHVKAFARALSGWTYAKVGGTGDLALDCPTVGKSNTLNYTQDMIGCAINHDSSSQTLLTVDHDNNSTTPEQPEVTTAGGTPLQHLNQSINNIFKHSNVPPFICKQLIQHLVTSNPTPAYVGRVVAKFKNNGSGVRGDMKTVIRAILEDNEARGATPIPSQLSSYGHLRSPVLHVTNLVRWLDGHMDLTGGKNPGAKLAAATVAMSQSVTRPPSVFSFYPPTAPLPGQAPLLGPEFAIFNAATSTTRANVTYDMLFTAGYTNAGVTLNVGVLPTTPDDLVTWLARYPLHGSASSDLQVKIYETITDPWATNTLRKQRMAMMLAALSPEFSIQR